MANDFTVGILRALLTADTAQFEDGMRKSSAAVKKFGDDTKTQSDVITDLGGKITKALAGAFTITAAVAAGKQLVDYASKLTDLSQRTGISTTGLQKLTIAFEASGVSIDSVARAVGELGARLVGDKGAQKLLEQLGFSVKELLAMSPEERFFKVADAVGNIRNEAEKTYASKTLFGKGGIEMLQGLNGHLEQTVEQFKDLIIPPESIAAADEFGDKMGFVGKQLLFVFAEAITPLIPSLTALMNVCAGLASVLGKSLGFVLKGVTEAFLLFWQYVADVLGNLGELAQRVPLVAKHLGFLGDATQWLHDSAKSSQEMLYKLALGATETGTATQKAGQAAETSGHQILGLGDSAETSGRKIDFLKTQMGQFALANVKVQMSYDDLNKSMAEQGVHLPKLAVMHEDLATKTDVLTKSSEQYLQIHTLTRYELLKSIQVEQQHVSAFGAMVDGMKKGLDDLWQRMSGGHGFAGLMNNLGDSIVNGFGNIISGGLTSVINMGINLAVEGVKKIGSLIAGLFSSEESSKVNKPRDAFFGQFGNNKESQYQNLANDLSELTGSGDIASALIKDLYDADTENKFHSAERAIIDVFANSGKKIAMFANGGIAMGPTLGVFGEKEPEAVIPLSRINSIIGGGQDAVQTIVLNLDGRQLARVVVRGMPRELHLAGVGL